MKRIVRNKIMLKTGACVACLITALALAGCKGNTGGSGGGETSGSTGMGGTSTNAPSMSDTNTPASTNQ